MSKKVSITVVEGPEKGKSFTFSEGTFTIGRGKANLTLTDKKVSGKHCEISVEGDSVWLTDHNSTNGTFIGTRKVTEKTQLRNMDQITVGLSRIQVSLVDDLAQFKKENLNSTGAFELDDLSGEEDEVVQGLLDESSLAKNFSIPIEREIPEPSKKQKQDDEGTATGTVPRRPPPSLEIPPPDAEYRETGIQRIENMISDELNAFSKWDHPSADATAQSASAVPKVKVTLKPRRGPDNVGEIICAQAVTSFGRKEVDVRLNDLDVSRKHASVEIIGSAKVFVRDLASTNGTYVNGKRVTYQELNKGDLLQIGQTVFEVEIEGES